MPKSRSSLDQSSKVLYYLGVHQLEITNWYNHDPYKPQFLLELQTMVKYGTTNRSQLELHWFVTIVWWKCHSWTDHYID